MYLVPIANNAEIEVWVQGEKIEGQWLFDDGTPIPNFCPINEGSNANQVHIRAKGSTSFNCNDADDSFLCNSCEYHHLLSFNN